MTFDVDEILNLFQGFNFRYGLDDSRMDELAAFLLNKNFPFTYNFGTTKAVIIPKDKDYVIKIPFNGYYDLNNEFFSFEAANEKDGWDYCKEEADRYKKISNNVLKDCFAETYLVGYIHDYPIYIQEKCSPYEHKNAKTKEAKKTMRTYLNHHTSRNMCLNTNWCIDFLSYYGEVIFNYFLHFIEEYDWGDDLSYDNVGYKAGRPIVIDYAGFREEREQNWNEILDTVSQEF